MCVCVCTFTVEASTVGRSVLLFVGTRPAQFKVWSTLSAAAYLLAFLVHTTTKRAAECPPPYSALVPTTFDLRAARRGVAWRFTAIGKFDAIGMTCFIWERWVFTVSGFCP